MQIVIVNYAYDAGAPTPELLLARHHTTAGWAEAVAAAGARVTVIQRFHSDAELVRGPVRYQFVREEGGGMPRVWQLPRRVHRAAVAARPDLVHLHGQIFPVQTLALRRALPRRTALVVQHHAGDPPLRRGARGLAWWALLRAGLGAADGFLFSDAALAAPWRAAGLIAPRQAVYSVMEASTTLRPPGPKMGSGPELPGDPALLWVGRLHPVKDPMTVLEGLARARAELPRAALSMVYGSEELLPAVRERAARPDLAGRVALRGMVAHAELPALYAAADMFVLGSRREGSGYALIEALACGLPPAVTDIPAFRAVTGAAVGALWPAGDPDGCARALAAVAAGDRAAQRAAALARFEQALSWPAVGRAAHAAYAAMVSRQCAAH